MTYNDVVRMTKFGVLTQNFCEFEIFDLIKNDPATLPIDANSFFELYIEDANKNLVDVPVLIRNFRDFDKSNPNDKFDFDYDNFRFVHRFFIYDTISGIETQGGYKANADPKYIRYAESVVLTIQLDPNVDERIRKPFLVIKYKEYATTNIEKDTVVPASFQIDFFMEVNTVERRAKTALWIAVVIIIIYTIPQVYCYISLNSPKQLNEI
jgi:hypothetical protein